MASRWMRWYSRKLVCHCLLIETDSAGLVLVDTGLGLRDIADPRGRLGVNYYIGQPLLRPAEAAVRQVEALGFSAADVRHIVLTHLDYDHAGGLSDFPAAKVHVFGPEFVAALAPANLVEWVRYRSAQWAHSPDWALAKVSGEKWFGFESARELPGLPPEILMVPLPGHTWGHCGIAVKAPTAAGGGADWLFHAGDAYYFHGEMRMKKPKCPARLRFFQRVAQVDRDARVHNQERLRKLVHDHAGEVRVFCSHDPRELERFTSAGAPLPAAARDSVADAGGSTSPTSGGHRVL